MKVLYGNELFVGDDVIYIYVTGKSKINLVRTKISKISGSRAYLEVEGFWSGDTIYTNTNTNLIKFDIIIGMPFSDKLVRMEK